MQNQFQIVFTGKILPGFTPEQVRENAARRLRLSDANQEAMFSGRRAVLRHSIDFATADTLREEYARLGMKVHLEPEKTIATAARAALNDDPEILPPLEEEELQPTPPAKPTKTGGTQAVKAAASVAQPNSSPASLSLGTESVAEEMTCPKCNARQPKRTLCRACGTDMPRFIAGQQQAERDARAARVASVGEKRPVTVRKAEKAPERPRTFKAEVDQPPLIGVDFGGRFSRSRYLVSSLLSICVLCLAVILTLKIGFVAFAIGFLFLLIQGVRSTVLRLHDMGQSGLLALLLLVPLLGSLFSLALVFWPGDEVHNDYGDAPLAAPLPLQLASFLAMVVLVALIATRMEQFSHISATDETSIRSDATGEK